MVEPGHVYECCGKVGRISRHYPWCPSRAPTTPVPLDLDAHEGHPGRECGEHRTTGARAWCFDCGEWCYPEAPCARCELPMVRDALRELVTLHDGQRDADYEHRKPAAWEAARRALDGDGQLQPRTRVVDDLREKIIEILDGYFRYTLELRLDEDIPAAADDLTALVDASYESAAGGTS